MKTIEFKSNYGNFAYRMTAEVGEELTPATEVLAVQGLANICYRVAGSSVDKVLGVKVRKDVSFSDDDGERINAAVSKKIGEMVGKDAALTALKLSFAVTGQHVFGEGGDAPTKEATEMWTRVQALKEPKFGQAMSALGFVGTVITEEDGAQHVDYDYDDASGILACKKKLTEAKAAAKLQAATLLGI